MSKTQAEIKVDILLATKTYEDKLQSIIGEDVFDDWLDEIPTDVQPKHYLSALVWMTHNLQQYRKPTTPQINNALTLTRINLNFNPAMGGKDTRGYFPGETTAKGGGKRKKQQAGKL